ncbi:hypothetical protein [Natrinema longum]|uniref:CopG family transcriptional regulator n=1 Tax=Natrinema longum TaxID=370324 RepID=A0A8A2UCV3_9EURY|nr:hypothetical protein [Natrinema longum]MBZ6495386.1 hypothetical protein [Natrinema longum]QSW86641.1 hypothetical protein J0X27_07450 [Natrinema longum]
MAQHDENQTGERQPRATVELPAAVHARIEKRLAHSEFDTTDEYVTFVLEGILGRVEDATDTEAVTVVDQEEVETRLQALGYRS